MKSGLSVRAPCAAAGLAALLECLSAMEAGGQQAAEGRAQAVRSHHVVACYFHRTVRCPTCKRISAYIEEAVQTGFARELREGRVGMVMLDFQDPNNEALAKAYHVTGPTLILMDVHNGKVARCKPAPKVWSLVGKKAEFVKYV
ncbi:MAG: nitrophenyl compound nitroreductase subunit ArsF family protein [Thermoguttaceae bacterium]